MQSGFQIILLSQDFKEKQTAELESKWWIQKWHENL